MTLTAITERAALTSEITKHTGPVDVRIFMDDGHMQIRAVVYASTSVAANAAVQAMMVRASSPAFGAHDVHASPATEAANGEWVAYIGWTVGGAS